jgi:hypothetical protein
MTQYEQLSLYLSIAAIVVSIASPIISYFLLDPQLQAFRNRAQLQIQEGVTIVPRIERHDGKPSSTSSSLWNLNVQNVGSLPAKDASIVLRYRRYNDPDTGQLDGSSVPNILAELKLTLNPPIGYQVEQEGDDFRISIKQPIPPNDTLFITVEPAPDSVFVSNEFGDITSISQTTPGLKRMWDHMPYFPYSEKVR